MLPKKKKEFATQKKISLKNRGKIITFSEIQKLEVFITSKPTLLERKSKGSHSSRRKMAPSGNMDLHKEVKNTRNSNYMGKYIRFFLIM